MGCSGSKSTDTQSTENKPDDKPQAEEEAGIVLCLSIVLLHRHL